MFKRKQREGFPISKMQLRIEKKIEKNGKN